MYRYDSNWVSFSDAERTVEDDKRDAAKAQENTPSVVLGQMGHVLLATLSVVLVTNLLLLLFHIH